MKSLIAALCTGVLVSLALFWLMQAMIMPKHESIKKTEPLTMVDFIRLKREPPPKEKPKPPEKQQLPAQVQTAKKPEPPKKMQPPQKHQPVAKTEPQKVVQAPKPELDVPKLDLAAPVNNLVDTQVSAAPSPAPRANLEPRSNTGKTDSGGGVTSGVIALVRIPPDYPKRAANRGIQGWVKIEFTITASGTVKDAVVVEAKPGDLFDEAALKAIRQWKFKEKIVNGVAVEQRAVQVLQFKLR